MTRRPSHLLPCSSCRGKGWIYVSERTLGSWFPKNVPKLCAACVGRCTTGELDFAAVEKELNETFREAKHD